MSHSLQDKRVSATYMKKNHSSPCKLEVVAIFLKNTINYSNVLEAPNLVQLEIFQAKWKNFTVSLKKGHAFEMSTKPQLYHISVLYYQPNKAGENKTFIIPCINHLWLCSHYFTFNRRYLLSLKGMGSSCMQTEGGRSEIMLCLASSEAGWGVLYISLKKKLDFPN